MLYLRRVHIAFRQWAVGGAVAVGGVVLLLTLYFATGGFFTRAASPGRLGGRNGSTLGTGGCTITFRGCDRCLGLAGGRSSIATCGYNMYTSGVGGCGRTTSCFSVTVGGGCGLTGTCVNGSTTCHSVGGGRRCVTALARNVGTIPNGTALRGLCTVCCLGRKRGFRRTNGVRGTRRGCGRTASIADGG